MKTQGDSLHNFSWQNGYGAFSVNEKNVETVRKYIDRQEEHHGFEGLTFREEYLEFLNEFNVPHDERYIFKEIV